MSVKDNSNILPFKLMGGTNNLSANKTATREYYPIEVALPLTQKPLSLH